MATSTLQRSATVSFPSVSSASQPTFSMWLSVYPGPPTSTRSVAGTGGREILFHLSVGSSPFIAIIVVHVPATSSGAEYVADLFERNVPSSLLADRRSSFIPSFRRHQQELQFFAEHFIPPAFASSDTVIVELGFSFDVSGFGDGPQAPASVASFAAAGSEKLVRGRYEEVRGKFEDDICAICLETMQAGEGDIVVADASAAAAAEASRLPCAHVFHTECVLQSLKRSSRCPLCRRDICS